MNKRVMPTFFADSRAHVDTLLKPIDLDVHTSSEVELHQRVHGLGCRINDVEQTLVRADLELVAGFLVHVGPRRTVNFSILFGSGLGRVRTRRYVWLCLRFPVWTHPARGNQTPSTGCGYFGFDAIIIIP